MIHRYKRERRHRPEHSPLTSLRRLSDWLQKALTWSVIAIGFSYPLGTITGIAPLRSVRMVLASSPMPGVFHYEEIAARIVVEVRGRHGESAEFEMGPSNFSKLRGPMVRRAAYILPAFSRLPRRIWLPIYQHGVCRRGPLARELGVPFEVLWAEVRIDYRTSLFDWERRLEIPCL